VVIKNLFQNPREVVGMTNDHTFIAAAKGLDTAGTAFFFVLLATLTSVIIHPGS
jgi:hypothetical protein